MTSLNVGCGQDVRKDWINLDNAKLPGVDVVHNLNKFPYPFKDNEFDNVICLNVLEHVNDFVAVLGELHRICKPGTRITLSVPYWNSVLAWADPQHKRGFTLDTFTYFQRTGRPEGDKSYYNNFYFKVKNQKLIGNSLSSWMPQFMLKRLSFFLCNIAQGMEVQLEVDKN